MEKKGMLYKRTFSAAASALMVLSACAPMSVFADEFEPVTQVETGDFTNEANAVPSRNNLYSTVNKGNLNTAFDDYLSGKDEDGSDITGLLGNPTDFEVRTAFKTNEIGNSVKINQKWKNDPYHFAYSGTAELSVSLGDLLGLEESGFVNKAVRALDKLSKTSNGDKSLSNGDRIHIQVTLEEGATFGDVSSDSYPSHIIGNVTPVVSSDKKSVDISLYFNDLRKVKDIVNAINGRDSDSISIKLPYSGEFEKKNNQNPTNIKMSVKVVEGHLFTLSGGENDAMKFLARPNGNGTSIDLLKNSSISVKPDEPVKPSKPSGTLTGGYPSSKPGNSTSTSSVRAMYRVYNPKTGEHLYTQSAEERDNLVRGGWNNEGIGWHAPTGSDTPVYRVFNPNSGDHHYTTNLEEYQTLTRIGWNAEGIGWYSASDKGAPIYRLYNKKIKVGSHHYTQNAAERDKLVNEGWVYEGIAWYAVK